MKINEQDRQGKGCRAIVGTPRRSQGQQKGCRAFVGTPRRSQGQRSVTCLRRKSGNPSHHLNRSDGLRGGLAPQAGEGIEPPGRRGVPTPSRRCHWYPAGSMLGPGGLAPQAGGHLAPRRRRGVPTPSRRCHWYPAGSMLGPGGPAPQAGEGIEPPGRRGVPTPSQQFFLLPNLPVTLHYRAATQRMYTVNRENASFHDAATIPNPSRRA